MGDIQAVPVLGEIGLNEDGFGMVEMIDGVEALVITNERGIIRTSGFAGYENRMHATTDPGFR